MSLVLSENFNVYTRSIGQEGFLAKRRIFAKRPLKDFLSVEQFTNEVAVLSRIRDVPGVLHPIDLLDGSLIFPLVEHDLLTVPAQLDVANEVLIPLLKTLSAFEARHLSHGDIKLENVRVASDRAIYLSDFGKAKLYDRHCPNRLGAISQHQAPDVTVSAQFDIYSLGVIAYQLLVGPHFMRDFVFAGRPESTLSNLEPNLRDFILRTTDPCALNRCQSSAEAMSILLSDDNSSSVTLKPYELAASFEVCLAMMKKTYEASGHTAEDFDRFIGDHGAKYHSRLEEWGKREDAILLHLKERGRIVGCLEAAVNKKKEAQISTLFIDDGSRRKGYASLLEQKAKDFFKSRGFQSIVLNVTKSNSSAIAYYRQRGWLATEASPYPGSLQFEINC